MKKIVGLIVLVALMGVIAGCGMPGQQFKGDSQLAITLTDKPATDIKEVWVTITKVVIQKGDEPRQLLNDLSATPLKVDLLTLRFDETLLGDTKLPQGAYERILISVSDEEGANTVVTNDGIAHALKVPANGTLHVNHSFIIEPNVVTELVLDCDVRDFIGLRGNANNNNGYIINPNAIRVIDKRISSDVYGRILDAAGNAVTTTNVNVEIFDADNTLVTSTIALAEEFIGEDGKVYPAGSFVLKGLLAGTYKLVVTAEGYTQYTSEPLTIVADQDVVLADITLEAAAQ